jgi:hypothetical protein
MKIYLVWNEEKTEGFFTTDQGVAYEARKSADTNCYDQNGKRSDLAIAFCNIHGEGNCTMQELDIQELPIDKPTALEILRNSNND